MQSGQKIPSTKTMARSVLAVIPRWQPDRKMRSSVVKEERCPAPIRPERRRNEESEPSFQVPLRSMNEASHCGILVKSRKKEKRNLPAFSFFFEPARRRLGKMLDLEWMRVQAARSSCIYIMARFQILERGIFEILFSASCPRAQLSRLPQSEHLTRVSVISKPIQQSGKNKKSNNTNVTHPPSEIWEVT